MNWQNRYSPTSGIVQLVSDREWQIAEVMEWMIEQGEDCRSVHMTDQFAFDEDYAPRNADPAGVVRYTGASGRVVFILTAAFKDPNVALLFKMRWADA